MFLILQLSRLFPIGYPTFHAIWGLAFDFYGVEEGIW